MADAVETILTTFFKIFDGGDVQFTVDSRNLGMAYAIPRGSEQSVVEDFGPWTECQEKQVFYRQGLLGETLAEIQLVMSWRITPAKQYVVEVFLDKNIICLDPTVRLSIAVRFNQPEPTGDMLEAYVIPFQVEITYKSLQGLGGTESKISRGVIRADGSGSFPAFDS